uniref:calcium-binding protein n=1 Tax=Rhizorhabdus sp. TaxID=1968843 RepID=UPI0035B1B17A
MLINGTAGADTLIGGAGDDRLEGGDGADTLSGIEGSDSFFGGNGDDVILAGAYFDSQDGVVKLIDGGAGTDRLEIDFYVSDAVTVDLGNPAAVASILIDGAVRGTVVNVERIDIGTGSGNDSIAGGELSDTLFGGNGNDTLRGGGGDDLMFGSVRIPSGSDDDLLDGGSGRDTVTYVHTGDRVSIDLNLQGQVQNNGLGAGSDILIGIENIQGSRYGDRLTGDDNANHIDGMDGSDLIDGRGGDDELYISSDFGNVRVTMMGGDGDDRISAYFADRVTLDGGNGDDEIIARVENAVIDAGAGDDMVTVDLASADTYVTLGAGSDTLRLFQTARAYQGGTRVIADFQTGDDGDILDLADYATNPVFEYVPSGGNLFATGHFKLVQSGADTLFQVDTAGSGRPSYFPLTMLVFRNRNVDDFTSYNLAGQHPGQINPAMGTNGNDVLTGTPSRDSIDGGAGNDTMTGGAGDDRYLVDQAGDVVIERDDEGDDLVIASLNYTLPANVENLILTGNAPLVGIGNVLSNAITGNSGSNVLAGGEGNDTLEGGAGDDILVGWTGSDSLVGGMGDDLYVVDEGGPVFIDSVVEQADQGTDTVNSSASFTLPDNVENLVLAGTGALSGIGNALANILTGNVAGNQLSGGDGNDSIYGGAGGDTLSGGEGD